MNAAVNVIGLTGGIGSGKSAVAATLAECGALRVDVDAISHALTLPGGAAIAPIRQRFGDGVIGADGALDRQRMREQVFADAGAKAALEAILHPMIGAQALAQGATAAPGQVVVYDVPLITPDSLWRLRADRLLVVDCGEDTQCQRVMRRSGWSEAMARAVIAQQLPRAARRALADAVIHNEGLTLDELAAQVRRLWAIWAPWAQR
jgi:dephospho-CoA kinase